MGDGKPLDPKEFGLHARTILERVDEKTVALVIDRASRIIMADGRKIADKAKKIGEAWPGTRIVLATSAPVCSKTKAYLEHEGIMLTSLG